MTVQSTLALSSLGLATIAGGATAWAHYGGVIYFDLVAAGLAGCFL